jgi:hypothetical protein
MQLKELNLKLQAILSGFRNFHAIVPRRECATDAALQAVAEEYIRSSDYVGTCSV